jgi:hypothetical protein
VLTQSFKLASKFFNDLSHLFDLNQPQKAVKEVVENGAKHKTKEEDKAAKK